MFYVTSFLIFALLVEVNSTSTIGMVMLISHLLDLSSLTRPLGYARSCDSCDEHECPGNQLNKVGKVEHSESVKENTQN